MLSKRFFKFSALTTMCFGLLVGGAKLASTFEHYGNNENNVSILATEPSKKASSDFLMGKEAPVQEVTTDVTARVSEITYTNVSASVGITFEVSNRDKSYYVGYGLTEQDYKPASLVYKVRNTKTNAIEERTEKVNKLNKNAYYDPLGVIGKSSITTYVDINLHPDEEIVTDSFGVTYLLEAIQNPDTLKFEPKLNASGDYDFKRIEITPKENSILSINLANFIEINYVGSSLYNGSGFFNFELTGHAGEKQSNGKTYYQNLGRQYDKIYTRNIKKIESGLSWVRSRFIFQVDTQFKFTMNDGSVIVKEAKEQNVDSTIPNSHFGFTYAGVDPKEVKNIEFYNIYLQCELFSSETNKFVPQSRYSTRFNLYNANLHDILNSDGTVAYEGHENSYFIDSGILLYSIIGAFALIYVAASLATYFILKEKNKDDEFKRMRTKSYFSNNTLGFIASGSLLISIVTIALRATILNSSFRVYNEIDILIVVFSIAAIIFCGYFIKYFSQLIKIELEKKKNEKLNLLAQNSLDDGTLIIPKHKEEKEN